MFGFYLASTAFRFVAIYACVCISIYVWGEGEGCDEKSRDSFGRKENKKRVNAKVMQISRETNRY